MTAKEPFDRIVQYEKSLQSFSMRVKLEFYNSPAFLNQLPELAQLLLGEGATKKEVDDLTAAAAHMKTLARRVAPQSGELILYSNDMFEKQLTSIINGISDTEEQKETDRLRRAIDGSYTASMSSLLSIVPDDLATSRSKLNEAITEYSKGDKVKAVLRTREAWEACVNYALSKLPPKPELRTQRDKAKYIWKQLGQQDSSGLFVEVKQLFEGAFLHIIEGDPKVKDPEVPFFISITTGFVHLVSESIAKSQKKS